MSRVTVLYLVLLLIGATLFGFNLYRKNREIHAENQCAMTFMYRRIFLMPIPIPDYNEGRYSLLQYSEAFTFSEDYVGGPHDIPVLFVPGSGGSGAQVRSLASVMQNKTEMRRAPFRMHFYALDFKEEMSFLSGNTLIRQREFLIKSIKVLQKKYPLTADKMIIFGHSFGGVVIRSLPLHPDFKPNMMNFILTSAAPLLHFPIVLDFPMANFYTQIEELWERSKEMKLEHVKFLSFSGGEKDFLVPDRMVSADNIIHLPSWSIPGVETPADHLCILWCNQLVRYTSRILFDYGEKAASIANPQLTQNIINEFEAKESSRIALLRQIVANFNSSEFTITSVGTLALDNASAKTAFKLRLPFGQVFKIHIQCTDSRGYSCSEKLKTAIIYPNGWTAFGDDSKFHGIRVKTVLLRPITDPGSVYVVLEGMTSNIDYVITVEADYMASWYMLAINYGFDILSAVYFSAFFAIPLAETTKISAFSLAIVLLTAAFLGIMLLIFNQYVLTFGITGIILLLAEYIPLLGYLFHKMNNRYFCILLACFHPNLAVISTFLRHNKMRSSLIFLVLSIATIAPPLFEGAKPQLCFPIYFYYLIKEINIFNPAWLYFYYEFATGKGMLNTENVWNLIATMVTFYNILFIILASQIFEQVPLLLFPLFFMHILLLAKFSPKIRKWWRRIYQ